MSPESNILNEILDYFESKLLVGHLAPAKTESDLHFHVIAQKVDRVAQFDSKIMRIDGGAQLNFFYLVGVLMLLGIFILFRLLITELAEINQATHRRGGVWSDLDQIYSLRAGHVDGFAEGDDSELLATRAYDAYFACTDLAINSNKGVGRSLTRSERATQDTLFG